MTVLLLLLVKIIGLLEELLEDIVSLLFAFGIACEQIIAAFNCFIPL